MKKFSLLGILFVLILFTQCKRSRVLGTRFYTFEVNPFYVGTHPVANLSAELSIKESKTAVTFIPSLINGDESKNYKVGIYAYDETASYGYQDEAKLDLGIMQNAKNQYVDFEDVDFDDFDQNFKGYFIINDPDNVSKDTTSLLIFGKIGF